MRRCISHVIFLVVFLSSATAGAGSPILNKALADLGAVKGSFTFAVIGDNRSGDRIYAKVIKRMEARKPLFVMNTGDVIPNPGNREEWLNFWKISKPIDVPYFLVAGNHDIDSKKSEAVWRDEVDLPGNETYYSFVVGKNLFVVLNTCEPKHDRRIAGEQLRWLKSTLNPARYEHQFIFLHHPLFLWKGAKHYHRSLDRYPKLRDELHRLFVEKGVTAVFAGHEHTFRRMGKIDGVEYIITGGAGAPLYSGYSNVVILKVDGSTIDAKVIDRKGQLRDEFFIEGP